MDGSTVLEALLHEVRLLSSREGFSTEQADKRLSMGGFQ
jgi:hypothetical protein